MTPAALRICYQQRQHILQLITEAECTAALIKTRSSYEPRCVYLIQQSFIHYDIKLRAVGFYGDHFELFLCKLRMPSQCGIIVCLIDKCIEHARIVHAEQEDELRFTILYFCADHYLITAAIGKLAARPKRKKCRFAAVIRTIKYVLNADSPLVTLRQLAVHPPIRPDLEIKRQQNIYLSFASRIIYGKTIVFYRSASVHRLGQAEGQFIGLHLVARVSEAMNDRPPLGTLYLKLLSVAEHKDTFAGSIRYGVIRPRSYAPKPCIFRKGIASARLRHERPDAFTRNNIAPRQRRIIPHGNAHHILACFVKAAMAVEE